MEKKEDSKRKRSENWNEADKELIRKRVDEIENKNTDTNTNQEKKKAWLAVEESFNNLCTGGPRTMHQIKTQWTATKVLARKEVSKHRKEVLKTGGGEAPPEIALSSGDISVWLPNEFVVDSNEFDSDVAFVYENLEIGDELPTPPGKEEQEGEIPDEDKIQNVNTPRCTFKKQMPTKRKVATHDNITRIAEFDMKCRRELHELQMEVEKKRMRNLDREHDLTEAKIKFLENKWFDKNRN